MTPPASRGTSPASRGLAPGPGRPGSAWPRHAWFLAALIAGIALRVVVSVAYRPVLLFPDSGAYINDALHVRLDAMRPSGYSLFLFPFLHLTHSLAVIPAVHHVLGLGLSTACYALLRRRGLPDWASTLAVLPLLLDPLQLVLEHYALSDVLFETLLVLACVTLLWNHRPGFLAVVLSALFVGYAATVRGAGAFLLPVFLVAVLCLRLRWTKVVAFLVAAALPLGAYMGAFYTQHGEFAVSSAGPRFLYARIAPWVYCRDPQLNLPKYEQMLCPGEPPAARPSTDYYMWGEGNGPQYHVVPPPGMTQLQVVKNFDKHVVRSEPIGYAKAVLKDFAGGFAPVRTYDVPGYPASYWLFEDHYWSFDHFIPLTQETRDRLTASSFDPTAARFLVEYRRWVYTPGPLMGALLLAAVGAVLGLGRARRSGDRVAVGLLTGACVLPLLTGAALSGFSWRYQLPQIPLIPTAGVLGVAALWRGRAAGRAPGDPPLRVLDRAADLVLRAPMPVERHRAATRAAARGRLQMVIAACAGALVAVAVAAAALASGWFLPPLATAAGLTAGVITAGILLAARRTGSGGPRNGSRPDGRTPAGEAMSTDPVDRR